MARVFEDVIGEDRTPWRTVLERGHRRVAPAPASRTPTGFAPAPRRGGSAPPPRSPWAARGRRRQDPRAVIAEIVRHESPAALVARVLAPDIEREERNRDIRAAALLASRQPPAATWFGRAR